MSKNYWQFRIDAVGFDAARKEYWNLREKVPKIYSKVLDKKEKSNQYIFYQSLDLNLAKVSIYETKNCCYVEYYLREKPIEQLVGPFDSEQEATNWVEQKLRELGYQEYKKINC